MQKLNVFIYFTIAFFILACTVNNNNSNNKQTVKIKKNKNKPADRRNSVSKQLVREKEPRPQKKKKNVKVVEKVRHKWNRYFYIGAFESRGFLEKKKGEYTGFFYDIAALYAQKTDKKVKVLPLKSYSVYKDKNKKLGLEIFKKVDIIIDNITQLNPGQNGLKYIELLPVKQVLVSLPDHLPVTSYEQLAGEKIIVASNSPYAHNLKLKAKAKNKDFNIIYVDNPKQQLSALKNQWGTMTIMDNCRAFGLLEKKQNIKIGSAVSKKQTIGFVISKNKKELAEKLRSFKKEIFLNDQISTIWSRYISDLDYFVYFAEHDR